MKSCFILLNTTILILITGFGIQTSTAQNAKGADALFRQLAYKDSMLFDIAFNTCNVKAIGTVLSKDFVFFHDNGYDGITVDQSLSSFTANLEKFCANPDNKMRREIVKGSLQAFAVGADEAVQTGVQRLYMIRKNQPEQLIEASKFTRTWKKTAGDWKMTQETDFLVKTQFDPPSKRYEPAPYVPSREPLYDVIVRMDSLYFDTYNTCNLEKMAAMTSDSIEFYHDRGGLTTSKKDLIASIKKNICGKVTRELMPGSIEVYPIPNYGAVEIGYHRFHNNQEPGAPSHASKFVTLWQRDGDTWKIARVISLH
ncbi:nuclear transport factor 2 family protein [Chitinophaga sp. RAB17]|uniref:nuclear transport factor 2 family protein n=1 Tax=Chitinophaga sp. RAB17 TaxID=3233049 RepID=UPI003F92CDDA